jgi:ADP-ribosylation factor GTPase-activating protein 1
MKAGLNLACKRYEDCYCQDWIYRSHQLTTCQLAEADIASQARTTAGTLGQTLQTGVTTAGTQFNRFVEGDSTHASSSSAPLSGRREPERKDFWESFGAAPAGPPKEKQDFWDEFASAGETRVSSTMERKKPSGIGTSAMKKSSGAGGMGGASAKKDDEWGEW